MAISIALLVNVETSGRFLVAARRRVVVVGGGVGMRRVNGSFDELLVHVELDRYGSELAVRVQVARECLWTVGRR